MGVLQGLSHVSSSFATFHHWHCTSLNKAIKRSCRIRIAAKLSTSSDEDPLFRDAIHSATLRYQETLRPDPLFHDPYVACLGPPSTPVYMKHHAHPYCLATRFIDDTLLQTLRDTDELKQVVLLTDGADTRMYRLSWPSSTLIFEISPDRIYCQVSPKLKDIGAQISRSCLLLHVSQESLNLQEALQKKGFNGSRPSIWILQGLPLMTLASFEDVLSVISSLATKGSCLIGELPAWLAETELEPKTSLEEWLHKLFMRHGFQVHVISYEEIARSLGKELLAESSTRILFVAEHMRFSDDQTETWRREFQRAEEEGDEEGFEDL